VNDECFIYNWILIKSSWTYDSDLKDSDLDYSGLDYITENLKQILHGCWVIYNFCRGGGYILNHPVNNITVIE